MNHKIKKNKPRHLIIKQFMDFPVCLQGDEYETTSKSYGTCYSGVCYNGGTCIAYNNGYPGYYCNCPSGFTGLHCKFQQL